LHVILLAFESYQLCRSHSSFHNIALQSSFHAETFPGPLNKITLPF
jgi:hypothetical protein